MRREVADEASFAVVRMTLLLATCDTGASEVECQ